MHSKERNYFRTMKRRNFILAGSALGAGAFFAPDFPWIRVPKKIDRKWGIALVGLGYYSTDLLAPALQMTKHCQLKGIVTGSPDKARQWQMKYNLDDKNIYNYQSFDQIANNPDIDVIYVVLPPSMHEEYVVRAAKAGKQVMCEKPMAVHASECQNMIDACTSNKVSLAIGYRMHHEANTKDIMQLAISRPYGKIKQLSAQAGYVDNRTTHWKQVKALGGGCMLDMGVYPLNAVRYATGLEPIAVHKAVASTTRPEIYKEVEETMNFDLEFPGGIMASCKTSFGENMNTLQVDCENGWYKMNPFQGYSGNQFTTSDGKLNNKDIQLKTPYLQARQMDGDVLAMKNKTSLIAPGEEGLKDIMIVEAIKKSAATGQRVTF